MMYTKDLHIKYSYLEASSHFFKSILVNSVIYLITERYVKKHILVDSTVSRGAYSHECVVCMIKIMIVPKIPFPEKCIFFQSVQQAKATNCLSKLRHILRI